MALTQEQIKNLKQGDPLIIHGTFETVDDDGDICIKSPTTFCGRPYYDNIKYAHPSVVSIVEPKHDPTRLFKKGDKVRVIKCKGRSYSKYWEKRLGQILTVTRSEDETTSPEVDEQTIDPAYLELVTPVEEIKPYSVLETDTINGFDIMRDGLCVMTFPYGSKEAGYYRNEPAAKEAAEAECARLNQEWRKEYEK